MLLKNIFCSLLLLLISCHVFAGWPVGKHQTVISNGYSYYYAHNLYDKNWRFQKANNSSDYFIAHSYNFYLAHGLTRRLDVIGSIPFSYCRSKNSGVINEVSGFGDAFIGLAYSKENYGFTKYFTIQGSVIIPAYENDIKNPLKLGYQTTGMDITLNYAFNPSFFENNGYIVLQQSYRHYFADDGPDQFLGDATIAYVLHRFNQFQFNIGGIVSNSHTITSNLNPTINKDYNSGKVSLSYGRKLRRTVTAYLSGFYTFIGRNTGQGFGASASVIVKVP